MATTIKQTEALPEAYPDVSVDSTTAGAAADPMLVWQRIEAYVAHRWTEETWNGSWTAAASGTPPLTPATISTVEVWQDDAWTAVTLSPSPLGGYVLPGGTYRFTGTVGAGDVPAGVLEAFRRLAAYMAAEVGRAGASAERIAAGSLTFSFSRVGNRGWPKPCKIPAPVIFCGHIGGRDAEFLAVQTRQGGEAIGSIGGSPPRSLRARQSYIAGRTRARRVDGDGGGVRSDLWENGLSMAGVTGTDLLDRRTLALIGRSLALRGEAVFKYQVRAGPGERLGYSNARWSARLPFRISVSEAGGGRTETIPCRRGAAPRHRRRRSRPLGWARRHCGAHHSPPACCTRSNPPWPKSSRLTARLASRAHARTRRRWTTRRSPVHSVGSVAACC